MPGCRNQTSYPDRAREKIDANDAKILAAAEKYRMAWRITKEWKGVGNWTNEWRELKPADVRCLQSEDLPGRTGSEGRRTVSWIWMAADRGEDDGEAPGLNEGTSSLSCTLVEWY